MHFTIKPASFHCNLRCQYCFYLNKGSAGIVKPQIMDDRTLKSLVKKYIAAAGDHVFFTFQGGEPCLAGLKFFEKALAYQKEFAGRKIIENALQTNGTLLDDKWASFLKEHKFLVGISLDGPEPLHDALRRDVQNRGTFTKVISGIELIKKHQIPFNILCCLTSVNASRAVEVYKFLTKSIGAEHLQFSGVVETTPENSDLRLFTQNYSLKPFSISPKAYGQALSAIFNYWIENDIGRVHVREFETFVSAFLGGGALSCVFGTDCSGNYAAEANGDIYECDQLVYPGFKLGNIADLDLNSLKPKVLCSQKSKLAKECLECRYLSICQGGCPKHRILNSNGMGKSYFCEGYKEFFKNSVPYFNAMGALQERGIPFYAVKGLVPKIRSLNA